MKLMRKTDFILLLILLAIGFIIWNRYTHTLAKELPIAEIYIGSSLVERVKLDESMDYKFTVDGKEQVLLHLKKNGSIAFEVSDCPDQICVRSGALNTVGQSAACLPNGMIIKIVSDTDGKKDNYDIII